MPWAQGARERGGQWSWLHRHAAQRVSGDKPNSRNQILVGTGWPRGSGIQKGKRGGAGKHGKETERS